MRKIVCDRCGKETDKWSGTPNFKICEDCFNELQNDGSIPEGEKNNMRKLKRDIVISVVNGKDLVGVYFEDTNGEEVLLECSPQKADKIIKIWNKKE